MGLIDLNFFEFFFFLLLLHVTVFIGSFRSRGFNFDLLFSYAITLGAGALARNLLKSLFYASAFRLFTVANLLIYLNGDMSYFLARPSVLCRVFH